MPTVKLISVNIALKDYHMLSFRQIKIRHSLKCTLKTILSNFIPVIISGHMVNRLELLQIIATHTYVYVYLVAFQAL